MYFYNNTIKLKSQSEKSYAELQVQTFEKAWWCNIIDIVFIIKKILHC